MSIVMQAKISRCRLNFLQWQARILSGGGGTCGNHHKPSDPLSLQKRQGRSKDFDLKFLHCATFE